jgi:hypothetical protein
MRIRGKQASVSVALAIAIPLIPCLAYLTSSAPLAHRYPRPAAPSSRHVHGTQAQSTVPEWPVPMPNAAPNPGRR